MTAGLISTIIPVHNRPEMLRHAVASVLAQSYENFEVIIVDDESSDDTPRAIDDLLAADARVRAIRRTNGGPGLARESGRQMARGELIQYLDSDDLLSPRKFELQVAALQSNPEAGVAYGLVRYRNASDQEIACDWKPANQKQTRILPSFLLSRWWETVSPLYRKSVTDAAGPWTALRLEEDWEYDCRIGALDVTLAFVDEIVGEHRDHSEDRLSRGSGSDPRRLRDRARAHELIAMHAERAGVAYQSPEFRHFARELFHLARQCGAAELINESQRLLRLARKIAPSIDLHAYELIARTIGWRRAARTAGWIERFR